MENQDNGTTMAMLTKELSALRIELERHRAAESFKEYVTVRQLRVLFGMSDRVVARMKVAGLVPVHAGTKTEVFRVADIKALMERPEPLPGSQSKVKPKAPAKKPRAK